MLFNSLEFFVFLPVVFGLYWYVAARNLTARNLLLLAASYVFYGWWDWRFLGLIIVSTVVDYLVGRGLAVTDAPGRRRLLLLTSLATNLGLLGFFKYWNFFIDSWVQAWGTLGVEMHPFTLQIILPVGISFYTFQTLSYTIDLYRRRIEATRDPLAFAAFVAFFPQLVAGPIERAANLLPQFSRAHVFSYRESVEGLRQILWGLFKKVVIADQLAPYVDAIFAGYADAPGSVLAIGAVLFAFQIYCDFSGYSDIAIGTARLFGFRLMSNFRYPYFARDIGEFWRRWHISLSTWFRDYVYIPLGGSRGTRFMTFRNISIVFVVSGLWHGANWTFVAWGAIHAALFLPSILRNRHRRHLDDAAADSAIPTAIEAIRIAQTFALVCVAWVFFRAENITQAVGYLQSLVTAPFFAGFDAALLRPLALVAALTGIEWLCRFRSFALAGLSLPRPARWMIYFGLGYWIVISARRTTEFIYFQF
ncbi:MAG: MBOAT family protein [Gammaproteobacteria bacterium]|nr:MBOAT family protein [Gammaproteobacteria bacterium]